MTLSRPEPLADVHDLNDFFLRASVPWMIGSSAAPTRTRPAAIAHLRRRRRSQGEGILRAGFWRDDRSCQRWPSPIAAAARKVARLLGDLPALLRRERLGAGLSAAHLGAV